MKFGEDVARRVNFVVGVSIEPDASRLAQFATV